MVLMMSVYNVYEKFDSRDSPSGSIWLSGSHLTPFIDHCLYEVTMAMAGLGGVEVKQQEKGVERPMAVQKPTVRKAMSKTTGLGSGKAAGTEPVKISHTQMWEDLLAAGVKKEKIDEQPNDVLLALRRQLQVGQTAFPEATEERQFPLPGPPPGLFRLP